MFKLALKGILARKGRLLLTSLADILEDTDAYVRSSVVIEGDFGSEERQRLPESLTAEVAQVPGVKTAESSVLGFARVIGKDGKPIGKEGNGPPNCGSSIAGEGETIWKVSDGRLPVGDSELALDTSTADSGGYVLGDTVKVVAQGG